MKCYWIFFASLLLVFNSYLSVIAWLFVLVVILLHCSLNGTPMCISVYITLNIFKFFLLFFYTTLECLWSWVIFNHAVHTQNHPECQIPPAQSDGNNTGRGRQSSSAAMGRAQEPQQVEGVHHPVSVEYNLRLFHFRPLAACTTLFTELHHSLPHLQKTCHLIPLCAQCILLRASNSFLSIFVLLIM